MSGDRPSVGERLHTFIEAALRHARSHLALFQHEWKQERSHLLELMWRWALFAVAALTLYQMAAAFIVLAFWYTPWRLHAMGLMLLLTGGITYWAWNAVQAVLARSEQPFARSIEQFEKDREVLERIAGHRKPDTDRATAAAATTPDDEALPAADSSMPQPAAAEREHRLNPTEAVSRIH
jgi:uncharacterized membrane protein YqjE